MFPPFDSGTPALRFVPFASERASALPAPPYAIGDLLVATAANALSKLPDVAIGSVLASGGVGLIPAWSTQPVLNAGALVPNNVYYLGRDSGGTARNLLGVNATNDLIIGGSLSLNTISMTTGNNLIDWAGSGANGVAWDLTVAGVARLRNLAHNAFTTLDCLGLRASGVAGFNGTVTPITSITVTNGIVTAVT